METLAASTIINAKRPGEDAFKVCVEIGILCQVNDDPNEWACPVSLNPLYNNLHDAHGGDAVQSLCLAMSLAIDLLSGFREKGGRLFHASGDDVSLDAYSFGAAKKKEKSE